MKEFFSIDANATTPESTANADAPGIEGLFIQLILIFVIFYFILIRPQQKKQKALQQLTANLKKGDKVVTISGVFGTVSKSVSGEKYVELEIAENVKIKILRSSIQEIEGTENKAKIVEGETSDKKTKTKKKKEETTQPASN